MPSCPIKISLKVLCNLWETFFPFITSFLKTKMCFFFLYMENENEIDQSGVLFTE